MDKETAQERNTYRIRINDGWRPLLGPRTSSVRYAGQEDVDEHDDMSLSDYDSADEDVCMLSPYQQSSRILPTVRPTSSPWAEENTKVAGSGYARLDEITVSTSSFSAESDRRETRNPQNIERNISIKVESSLASLMQESGEAPRTRHASVQHVPEDPQKHLLPHPILVARVLHYFSGVLIPPDIMYDI
ncbi:hypothetical protein BDN70DRAFT_901079, partial [Pholiota conissans]